MSPKNRMTTLPAAGQLLPGRSQALDVPELHFVLGTPLKPPFPPALQLAFFGMGCFWGAERLFWQLPGVHVTAAGYAGGGTPNPSYEEVCSGLTGHTEVVQVVFDPARISYEQLLKAFWESHDPTQGMRQGGDIGTQYRSAIYATDEDQYRLARQSRNGYDEALSASGHTTAISTEILRAPEFYYAEDYHQQYLAKNPERYCGLDGTGVSCPVGTGLPAA